MPANKKSNGSGNKQETKKFTEITGAVRLFEREAISNSTGNKLYFYSTSISSKNAKGEYEKAYLDVLFSKDAQVALSEKEFNEDGSYYDVVIDNGWLNVTPEREWKDTVYPAKVGLFINKLK